MHSYTKSYIILPQLYVTYVWEEYMTYDFKVNATVITVCVCVCV